VHTTFHGEPLAYRGRGIEKPLGALVFFAVLTVPVLALILSAPCLVRRTTRNGYRYRSSFSNLDFFGASTSFSAAAQWRPLYGRFLFAIIGVLLIFGLAMMVVTSQFSDQLSHFKPGAPPPAGPKALQRRYLRRRRFLNKAVVNAALRCKVYDGLSAQIQLVILDLTDEGVRLIDSVGIETPVAPAVLHRGDRRAGHAALAPH
jgi:hypothetical protein